MDKSNLNSKQFGSDGPGEGKYVKKVGGRGKRKESNNALLNKNHRASVAYIKHTDAQHNSKADPNCDKCATLGAASREANKAYKASIGR